MERPSTSAIAASVLSAPAWALLGLTVRDPRLRERAADTLAARIAADLDGGADADDPRQIALPLID